MPESFWRPDAEVIYAINPMLPILLRPDGRPAVVVGGGNVAARKAETLAAAGYPLVVVAPSIDPNLRRLLERTGGRARERAYAPGDLAGAAMAIAATGDADVDARVVDDARAQHVPACHCSEPERGDFTMSATLRVGDVTVSVDSGGSTPALSKRVLAEIASGLDPMLGDAARTLSRMRIYVKAIVSDQRLRARIMRELANYPFDRLASMNPVQAEHEAEAAIASVRDDAAVPPPQTTTVVCATRASALATTQTRAVAARLAERGIATTILRVTTSGDRDRSSPIDRIGSINVFVTELEIALRERRADYAVHSCKDLPSMLAADMTIAAIPPREDPRDAFCSERYESFEALPAGAIVGTSSPRRRLLLAALRPDLEYRDLRGNVDTRLRKLRDGEYDAIVLAMAGLLRLRLRAAHTVPFSTRTLVPAVAQGALAVETLASSEALGSELHAALNDMQAELCVACERSALRTLRAGCSAPIGIHAEIEHDVMIVTGAYALPGGAVRRHTMERPAPTLAVAEALGAELAEALRPPLAGRLLILPRTREQPSRIAAALREQGADVIELAAGDEGPDPAEGTPDMLLFPSSGSVAAAGTYLDRLRTLARKPLVTAMGPSSAQAASAAGFGPDEISPDASIDAFLATVARRLGAAPQ